MQSRDKDENARNIDGLCARTSGVQMSARKKSKLVRMTRQCRGIIKFSGIFGASL